MVFVITPNPSVMVMSESHTKHRMGKGQSGRWLFETMAGSWILSFLCVVFIVDVLIQQMLQVNNFHRVSAWKADVGGALMQGTG